MTNTFTHGYALLVGVGRCAYDAWSLPVTVRDMQALRDVLADPALCGYPADHIRLEPQALFETARCTKNARGITIGDDARVSKRSLEARQRITGASLDDEP
jgi:hypothetical protein